MASRNIASATTELNPKENGCVSSAGARGRAGSAAGGRDRPEIQHVVVVDLALSEARPLRTVEARDVLRAGGGRRGGGVGRVHRSERREDRVLEHVVRDRLVVRSGAD